MSLTVQGTNDSCTVSKAAMVKKGYFRDIYVKNFVGNISNRSPIINRGYFIRAFSIQNAIAGLLREAQCGDQGIEQVLIPTAFRKSFHFQSGSSVFFSPSKIFWKCHFNVKSLLSSAGVKFN